MCGSVVKLVCEEVVGWRMSLEWGKDVAEVVLVIGKNGGRIAHLGLGEGQAVELPFCRPIPGEIDCPSVW